MAGKPAYSPDELARILQQLRERKHLTFREATREIGIPEGSIRYTLDFIVPKFAKQRPDLDWSIPVFSSRSYSQPAHIGIKTADERTVSENDNLKSELRELRQKLAGYDREYADHQFIKSRLFSLKESTVTPPDWLVRRPKAIKSPGIPCMMWSDWHWAEVIDPAQINGVNAYNLEIAHARAKALVERTIQLLRSYMVSPNYDGVAICLGGDMLSGNIHEELVNTNAVPIMAAVVDLWGVLEWAIKTMADEFGKVAIFCVTGNHGRSTHKVPSKDRAFTSFDWLVYAHLQHAFKDDKRVTIIAPNGSDILFAVFSHKFLLTHGDQFRGGDGMIGHIGPVTRGQKKKQSRNAEIGQEFDTMIHGHFHTYSPGDRVIGNGSLCGYNEYAASGNFAFEAPRQALWVVHPQHGITYHIPVYVDEAKAAREASAWVSWLEAA